MAPKWGRVLAVAALHLRYPNRFRPGMCTARARLHPVKIRADIVARQVQHLTPELPIYLALCLGRAPNGSSLRLKRPVQGRGVEGLGWVRDDPAALPVSILVSGEAHALEVGGHRGQFGNPQFRRYPPETCGDCYRNPIDNHGIAAMINSEMTS